MPQMFRPLVAGAVIGGLAAGLLALPTLLPTALADEQPMRTLLSTTEELLPRPLNVAGLVKPDFTVEPHVATEVLDGSTVRKIGYGETSFVTIAETDSGTYSSDGLASPHVRYPGIHVDRGGTAPRVAAVGIQGGAAWAVIEAPATTSFVSMSHFGGGSLVSAGGGSCVVSGSVIYC